MEWAKFATGKKLHIDHLKLKLLKVFFTKLIQTFSHSGVNRSKHQLQKKYGDTF